MHTVLTWVSRVLGLTVPATLAVGLALAPAASASTAPSAMPAMVQCQLPTSGPNHLVPFIGNVGAGPRVIAQCQFQVYATNVGRVIRVDSPYDGGHNPMYRLNAIAKPAAASLERKPIPTRNLRSMECSIVQRTLVPGLMARWPHVRCGVQFRQRLPKYLGSALELTYGGLTSYYSIRGLVSPCKVTTRIPVRLYPR